MKGITKKLIDELKHEENETYKQELNALKELIA